jgi:conjugal transfer pilus assembly protein TrbC
MLAVVISSSSLANTANPEEYNIQLPSITALPPELQNSLKTIQARINSKQLKQQQHSFTQQIAKGYKVAVVDKTSKQQITTNTKLVLFMSSSIPEIALKRYARDLAKLGGIMVMRGGVGGIAKIAPTMQFIHNILKQDSSCTGFKNCQLYATQIIIDPKLFTANNIQRVPALAYLPKLTLDTYCEDKHKTHNITSNHIIYGDASLAGLLDELIKLDNASELQQLKERLTDV